MLPRDTLGLPPVLRPGPANAVEALGDPRQQALQRALSGQVGKSMQGQVLARLADGSAIVRVADTAARMMLPPGAEIGSNLPLKLIALQPRPTFEMGSGAGARLIEASPAPPPGELEAALPSRAPEQAAIFTPHGEDAPVLYRPDGHAPAAAAGGSAGAAATARAAPAALAELAAPAAALAGAGMAEPGAALSPAGQVLGSVMAAVLRLDKPARAVAARVPALPAPGADPAVLAPALRQALEKSGLFYESHVAEWARGQRDLAALSDEPQMQARPASPADADAAQLINLQLSAHELGQVAWEGQLWPGQPLRWDITRDAPQHDPDGAPGDSPEPAWQSRLRLRFPLLGELDATVVLHGGQVAVRIALADEAVAGMLQAHAGTLADALAAAGTPLAGLAVSTQAGDE